MNGKKPADAAGRPLAVVQALLLAAAVPALAFALYMALVWAPTERTMGEVQRIFYFHVPSAWVAFACFLTVCVGSLGVLLRRGRNWDVTALAAAEVGMVFCTIVLLTGPIWAKPAWGIWWTWDARLTSTLVLWLVYAGYLLLRRHVQEPGRRARMAAVLGVLGFLDVPIVYFSIRWWRTQHPQPVIAGGEGSGLAPDMARTLLVCLAAVTLLAALLVVARIRLERLRDRADALETELFDREDAAR